MRFPGVSLLAFVGVCVACIAVFFHPIATAATRLQRLLVTQAILEPPDHPLRLGLVGASFIAKVAVLVPSRRSGSTVQVTAVAARSQAKASSYSKKHGIAKAFGGYDLMFNDKNIEAVYIAIPTALHIPIAKRAVMKGKHVLLEKPGGLSAQSLGELGELAVEQGVYLAVAYHWRFHHAAKRLKEMVQQIGKIRSISTRFSMYDPKGQTSIAKLADRVCYCLDLIRFVLPSSSSIKVVDASVVGTTVTASLLADTAGDRYRFGNEQVKATLISEKDTIGLPEINAVVEGSLGTITLRNFIFPMLYHSLELSRRGEPTTVEKVYGDGETTFELQLAAFADMVKSQQNETSKKKKTVQRQTQSVKDAQTTLVLMEELFATAGQGDIKQLV
jgi:predicted dehydrogenase